jgi:hypothetical protein
MWHTKRASEAETTIETKRATRAGQEMVRYDDSPFSQG